ELFAILAETMSMVHSKGIVHRDLKPANILLKIKSETRNPKSETTPKEERSKSKTEVQEALNGPLSDVGFASEFEFRISDYVPKITDFGLAKKLDPEGGQTKTGAVIGTPNYMAPEQVEGRNRDISPATDVFALGSILYELLTGKQAF